MSEHVIIDGNNLLHAMHAHAPLPAVGRETLVKIVERWAGQRGNQVTLAFDGPVPPEGLAKQMTSGRITVRFSAPITADDLIVAMIQRAKDPGAVRVVSSDTAIRCEARYRRCRHTGAVSFVAELFPDKRTSVPTPPTRPDKPDRLSPEEAQEWLDLFGCDDVERFDGCDEMTND